MRAAFTCESATGATDAHMCAPCECRIKSCDTHKALVLDGVKESATDAMTKTAADA